MQRHELPFPPLRPGDLRYSESESVSVNNYLLVPRAEIVPSLLGFAEAVEYLFVEFLSRCDVSRIIFPCRGVVEVIFLTAVTDFSHLAHTPRAQQIKSHFSECFFC